MSGDTPLVVGDGDEMPVTHIGDERLLERIRREISRPVYGTTPQPPTEDDQPAGFRGHP